MKARNFTPLRAAIATLIVFASTALLGRSALGWGRIGHRAAARLAVSLLSPKALDGIKELLEPGETLADASTWADEIRRERPETGSWHYVNVPITEDKYDPKFAPLPPQGSVVAKIADWRKVLADKNAPREQRREALRWIVHLVEDLHMPLHVGHRDDRGGNNLQVRFFDEGTNLHRLWDSGIIERESKDEDVWVRDLTTLVQADGDQANAWKRGTVEDWATESLADAKLAYRPPGSDAELKKGRRLGDDYQRFALPIARRRLAQAGVRLAEVLNEAFE